MNLRTGEGASAIICRAGSASVRASVVSSMIAVLITTFTVHLTALVSADFKTGGGAAEGNVRVHVLVRIAIQLQMRVCAHLKMEA